MKKALGNKLVGILALGLTLGATSSNVTAEIGSIDAIDCSESLGLVQMFFDSSTATAKQLLLDADAGSSDASNNYADFDPAWTVSFDVPGNDDLKELNGTAINPVDGKAYAAVKTHADREYLVRFDRDGDLEFLYEYSASVAHNGAFDSQGRYYSAATVDNSDVVQRWDNLDEAVGNADPASVTVRPADTTGPRNTNLPADITVVSVGGVEYVLGVPTSSPMELMVFNTETLTGAGFDVSSSVNRTGDTGLPYADGYGYGAAWTFEGTSYFSQNNGGGLWSLSPADIDIDAETATLREVLQTTQMTTQNDGFGCPDESPELPAPAGVANLRYHANGGTGEPDDLQTGPEESVTLSSQEPTRDGYTFVGWNTDSEGAGDNYSPSDAYVMPGDGETDHLYAIWQEVPTTTTTTTVAPTTTTTTVAPTTTTVAVETTLQPTTTVAPETEIVLLPATGSNNTNNFLALATASGMLGAIAALTAIVRRRAGTL